MRLIDSPNLKKCLTPSNLIIPSYALHIPTTLEVREPNNVWNIGLPPEEIAINKELALAQFLDLYSYIATESIAQLVPHCGDEHLQDLSFVANLGVVLEHCKDKNIAIVSNFTSPPRFGETAVGVSFFNSLGYNTFICPYKFEGSADLKWLHDNIYIGQVGQRSTLEAYRWMEENFDMKVIVLNQTSDKLYHLDCSIFPITKQATLVATEVYTKEELKMLEEHTEIIHVPTKYAEAGATNSVRMYSSILNSSDIDDIDPILEKEDYRLERDKNQFLEDICSDFAMEVVFVNLSEFMKSGALLSCCVLELNRNSYNVQTV